MYRNNPQDKRKMIYSQRAESDNLLTGISVCIVDLSQWCRMIKTPDGIKTKQEVFFYEETFKGSRIHDPDHCDDL